MTKEHADRVLGPGSYFVPVEKGSRFEDTMWFRDPGKDGFVNIVTGGKVYLNEDRHQEEKYRVVNPDNSSKSALVKIYPERYSLSEAEEVMKEYMRLFPVGNPTNLRIELDRPIYNNPRVGKTETIELNEKLTKFLPKKFIHWKMYGGRPRKDFSSQDTEQLDEIEIENAQIKTYELYSDYLDESFTIQLGEVSWYSDLSSGSKGVMDDLYADFEIKTEQ